MARLTRTQQGIAVLLAPLTIYVNGIPLVPVGWFLCVGYVTKKSSALSFTDALKNRWRLIGGATGAMLFSFLFLNLGANFIFTESLGRFTVPYIRILGGVQLLLGG